MYVGKEMCGKSCKNSVTFDAFNVNQSINIYFPMKANITECRYNRLRCPLVRMSGLQCFNMGHNGHGINLYGVSMTLMEN